MARTKVDGAMYAAMVIPHETAEKANAALEGFYDELYELRCKYKLADIAVIVQDSIADSGMFLWSAHCGNIDSLEVMAAWHLGQVQADRQDRVRKALDSNTIKKATSKK
jgi:hypothetical protein